MLSRQSQWWSSSQSQWWLKPGKKLFRRGCQRARRLLKSQMPHPKRTIRRSVRLLQHLQLSLWRTKLSYKSSQRCSAFVEHHAPKLANAIFVRVLALEAALTKEGFAQRGLELDIIWPFRRLLCSRDSRQRPGLPDRRRGRQQQPGVEQDSEAGALSKGDADVHGDGP